MGEIEIYFEKLFSDPAFGAVLGIVSIWYSYYLTTKAPKNNELLILTMSNYWKPNKRNRGQVKGALLEETAERRTLIIIINKSHQDILSTDVLKTDPLSIRFREGVNLKEININYNTFVKGGFDLLRSNKEEYLLLFEMIKRNQGIILEAFHDSKKFMDDVWTDIDVTGTIANFTIKRDDFSDQMIYRATSIEMPVALGTLIIGSVVAYVLNTFLQSVNLHIPFIYLFLAAGAISYLPIYNYVGSFVGYSDYKLFWKLHKQWSGQERAFV